LGRFPTENEVADAAQIATLSPEVKEMAMPVSQHHNNEQVSVQMQNLSTAPKKIKNFKQIIFLMFLH